MRDALARLQVIRFNPIEEVTPRVDFRRNVDFLVIDRHIHVLSFPFEGCSHPLNPCPQS